MADTGERADIGEIKTQIAEMRVEMKSVWRRLDEHMKLTESVQDLALSIKEITGEMKHLRENQDSTKRDVDELKARPAKRWDSIVGAVITGVVGFVISYIIFGGG